VWFGVNDFFLGGFGSIFSIVPLGLLVLLLSNRPDTDRSTKRPYMSYVDGVLVLGVIAFFVAAIAAVSSVGDRIFNDGQSDSFSGMSSTDRMWKDVVVAACVLLPVSIILWFHSKLRTRIRAQSDFVGSAHARTDRVFVYTVCLLSILTLGVTVPLMLISIAKIAGPGIMDSSRDDGMRSAFTTTIPLFGSLILLQTFWAQGSDDRAPVRVESSPAPSPAVDTSPPQESDWAN
jgi:hypothetical protein